MARMPFFKRGEDRKGAESAQFSAPPAPPGSICTQAGCGQPAPYRCAYSDRRQRGCGTTWCAAHLVAVGTLGYCRRHATVMRALAEHDDVAGMAPDIDNRAPSLAEWVGNDLGGGVVGVLERLRGPRADLEVTSEPLHLVISTTPRARQWQRAWKLSNHTGTAISLAISVDEERDAEVVLRVDSEAIGRIVPPWIAERSRQLSPELDSQWRKAFRDAVLGALAAASGRREESVRSHP